MKKSIQTNTAPRAVGPYSQAIVSGNTLYISGQIPIDPQTNMLLETTLESQTKQILSNIENIIKAASPEASINNIIKLTVFLTDLNDFVTVNKVFEEAFSEPYPARSTVQIAALPKNARLEIESIAQIR